MTTGALFNRNYSQYVQAMNTTCYNHPISYCWTRNGSTDHSFRTVFPLITFMFGFFRRTKMSAHPQNKEKVVYRVNYGSKDKSLLQFINSMNSNISTINNSSNLSQNTSKSAGNTLSNRLIESQSELTFKKKEVKILDKMGREMPWGNYEFEVIDTIDLTEGISEVNSCVVVFSRNSCVVFRHF